MMVTCVENHLLPSFGTIFITSDPIGSEIYLNDENTGKVTPDSLTELLSGEYRINLLMNEFIDSSFIVDITENQNLQFDIFMREENPTGKIVLSSNPNGANIFINDVNTNQFTPATFSNLERGIYKVGLKLDLYEDIVFNVVLSKDESITKNTQMIIAGTSGSLFVTSTPSGANIYLDDFNTGKVTPDTIKPLAPDNYSIKLSLADYRDTTITTTVSTGTLTTENVELTFYEPRGSITLNSDPEGARVYLNGKDTELFTPAKLSKLEAGNYEIKLELNSYFDTTFTVPVIADQNTNWQTVVMTEIPYIINVSVNPEIGGTVSGDGGYTEGKLVTLTATPNTGYNFINWTEGSSTLSTNPVYSFNATRDREIVANFELKVYEITAVTSPENAGFINGTGLYNHGQSVNLSVSSNAGFRFINWTENGSEISDEIDLTFIAESDRNFVANFEEIGNLIINTDPIGADIFLNDEFTGLQTPQTFVDLVAGEYTVTLKLPDFADTSIVTNVFSNQSTDLGTVFLTDTTSAVDVNITYTVNDNTQQLIFTFVFNQDIRFNRVEVSTPDNILPPQSYGGQLVPEGIGITWNYPEKILGTWSFTFRGRKVGGRESTFVLDKTVFVD